ncbi:MAG: PEP-CTERM sorting domain-containing protein [Planctomycetota bacterium]
MNRSLIKQRLFLAILVLGCAFTGRTSSADEVVAFWHFENDYNFPGNPNKFDFAAEVDNTIGGNANLQAFLGDETEFDNNGGGGFLSYTSGTSGITYGPSRTIKWDDLAGGGDDFDIGGVSIFDVDTGGGVEDDDFGNDALLYLTFDGTGFENFRLRFDIEGTPGDLPDSYDIFYRTSASNVWFRESDQNNIDLDFMDYDPADSENQFARSGLVGLSDLLDGDAAIEIIINDFDRNGNGEMEIDNIEIIAVASVPEPTSMGVLGLVAAAAAWRSRRRSKG